MSLDALDRALDNAYKSAELLSRRKAAPPTGVSLLGSDVGSGFVGMNTEATVAREQYRHYRGKPFSAIRVIANRISQQPLVVARIGKPANKSRSLENYIAKGVLRKRDVDHRLKRYTFDEVEIIPDHKLLEVIDDPNELMLPSNLWLVSVANLLVTGRCLWIIDPDPSDPEILPIPTTWATAIHDIKGGKLFARWAIKPPNSMDKPVEIDGDYVANFYIPDPEDPFGCISMLSMQGDSVLTAEAIETAQRVAFHNEINPTTAIYVGDAVTGDGKRQMKLTPEQRKQLITWIRQEHSGAKKFGLPMILDAIIRDVKILGNKPKEIGFIESSDQTEKHIYAGFGVPLSSAGISSGTGYQANAVDDHTLLENAVNPICKLFSEGITAWVLPLFSKGKQKMRAWIVTPDAYDPDLKIRLWNMGRQYNAASRNEFRTEMLGLPAIPGMDDVVLGNALRSVPLGEPIEAIINNGANEGGLSNDNGPPNDHADNENMIDSRKSFVKTVRSMWLKVQGEEESRLESTVRSYLRGQVKSAAITLRSMNETFTDGASLAAKLLPVLDWDAKLIETVKPLVSKQIKRGTALNLTSAERSATFQTKVLMELSPAMQQHIQQSIDASLVELVDNGHWKGVNDETRRQLSFILQEGMTEGDTLSQLADRIEREMGPEWSGVRALKIARTESGAGLSAGNYLAQQQLENEGIALGQEWLAIKDEDTRADHIEADGQQIGIGETFDIGGYPARYPGDPKLPAQERVNCRCVSAPIFSPPEKTTPVNRVKAHLNGHSQNGHSICC